MQTLKVDNKEYHLELSFNSMVDTDAMNELQEGAEIVRKVSAIKKGKNENAELMPLVKDLFRNERALLYDCLVEHHSEEFKTEKECGSLIQRAISTKAYTILEIFNIIAECAKESDFLSEKEPKKAPVKVVQ
jgi:hypothetical protein